MQIYSVVFALSRQINKQKECENKSAPRARVARLAFLGQISEISPCFELVGLTIFLTFWPFLVSSQVGWP